MYRKLHFYEEIPPKYSINREKLIEICEERLKLYKIVSEASHKYEISTESFYNHVLDKVGEQFLHTYPILWSDFISEDEFINDYVAHYMLRYLYCSKEADRQFFCKCECQILQMRFNLLDNEQIYEFYIENQKILFRNIKIDSKTLLIFHTEFQNIPEMVALRKCDIFKGTAYFSGNDFMLYLLPRFLRNISQSLNKSSLLLDSLPDNVLSLLKELTIVRDSYADLLRLSDNVYDISDYGKIDDFVKFFPLCMKTIHYHLKKNHHLKYHMKLQYCKFLKNIGVPFEVAMEFFKHEYLKKFTLNVFIKKHSYLFKHIYGKVGMNNAYKPATCDDILSGDLTAMQNHGCPFKHYDKVNLKKTLMKENLTEIEIQEIQNVSSKKKFQHACLTFYNKKMSDVSTTLPSNPQNYFCQCIENNQLAVDMEDMFL